MRAEKNSKKQRKPKTRKRILIAALAVLCVLLLLLVFVVPVFVSSEKGRKIILAKINRSVDGRADFASLSMSWWKGVRVNDFSFAGSAEEILVRIRQIATKPHYGSILMGDLSFGKTEVLEPRVEIDLGKWPPKEPKDVQEDKRAEPVTLPIRKIDVTVADGALKVTDASAKTVELSQISSEVSLRPPGKRTTFNVTMAAAGEGKGSQIHAEGKVTPKKKTGWSFKGTSGDFFVEVDDLDLDSIGPLLALRGIDVEAKGKVSANLKSEVKDGQIKDLNGTIKGKDLNITGGQLKGDRFESSDLDVEVELLSEKEIINVDKLEVHSDWIDADVNGVVPKTFKSLSEFVEPDSAYALKGRVDCNLAEALSQMPQTFHLKEGMKVTSGRLSGDIETSTEAGRRRISGQASLIGLAGVIDGNEIAFSEPVRTIVELTSDKDTTKFDRLDVSAAFCDIRCAGTSKLLQYTADVDLAKMQSELWQFVDLPKLRSRLGQFAKIAEYQMAGRLVSKGEVASGKDKISVEGSSSVKDLKLTSPEAVTAAEREANIDFSVTADKSKHIVDVNFVKATAALGQIIVRDSVVPYGKKAEKTIELAVSASDVDLEKLQPFAMLFTSFPNDVQLKGIADSTLAVRSERGIYRVVTDSTKVRDPEVLYPDKEPIFKQDEVLVTLDVEISPVEKSIAVKELKLLSPQIKIYKGSLSKTTKEGKTTVQGLVDGRYDWAAVTSVAEPFLPKVLRDLKLKGEREDSIEFVSEYPAGTRGGLWANMNTEGKLGFDWAYYKGLTFSPAETEIRIVKGYLKISQFSSKVNNGTFRFVGEADFKQELPLLMTLGPIHIAEGVQLNDDVSKELLVYINPIFANAVDVRGVGNLNCQRLAVPLRGKHEEEIEIVGTMWADTLRLSASNLLSELLSVMGLKLRDQKLRVHKTNFILKNGFLRYDNMQVDVGDNPFNFKGVIGLDESLDMIVTLPYTLDGRTVRVGQEGSAQRIQLRLGGTIYNPELDVGKLLEDQLKRRLEETIEEAILEGLGDLIK